MFAMVLQVGKAKGWGVKQVEASRDVVCCKRANALARMDLVYAQWVWKEEQGSRSGSVDLAAA